MLQQSNNSDCSMKFDQNLISVVNDILSKRKRMALSQSLPALKRRDVIKIRTEHRAGFDIFVY